MNVTIRKIGNSEGVIIPKELLEQLGVQAGDELDIRVEHDRIYLALLWQINSQVTMIGHPWHSNEGAWDGRAACCIDGLAEAVR